MQFVFSHRVLVLRAHAAFIASLLAHASQAAPLTLEQTLNLAEQRNPALQAARASVTAVQGELKDTRAPLWNNPQVNTEYRRRGLTQTGQPAAQRSDSGIGISQTFELGGQQQSRRGAAEAGFNAAQQTIEDTRREVRAEAAQRFVQVLSLQQRVQTEERALDILQRAAELVSKRVQAGEDSRLDGNLARVEAERAANQLAQAKERLVEARAALTTFLQLDQGSLVGATGSLEAVPFRYTLTDLLQTAANRPRLLALAAKERAAVSRLNLERGAAYPDITVGLSYSPENNIDGKDRITTLNFSLPLPLFRRNATGIGRARTELDQAHIERRAAERDTEPTVAALWQRLMSLHQRVDRLKTIVLPSLKENQELSMKALRAGELGLSQFLLVRRQVLDGQRDLLDAQTELRQAQFAIESAAGWPTDLPPLEAAPVVKGPR